MTAESYSAMHRLKSDELWHFYAGAPVRLLLLRSPDPVEVIMEPDVSAGQCLQYTVRAGTCMGAKPISNNERDWSLIGNAVVPGFEYADYQHGDRNEPFKQWP